MRDDDSRGLRAELLLEEESTRLSIDEEEEEKQDEEVVLFIDISAIAASSTRISAFVALEDLE